MALNSSTIKFNDLTNGASCLKSNITKSPPSHKSLNETLTTTYQGLYVIFGFHGWISKDKDGIVIEYSYQDIEGLNGEKAWIMNNYG